MSFVEIVSAIRYYGADVLLLALGVTLTVSLLKKTVMKNCPKKVFVVLPFLVGTVFYAVFSMISTWSIRPLAEDVMQTFENGFGCGCVATLYYVVYEHFLRGKLAAPYAVLLPLLEFIPEDRRDEAAKTLYEGAIALPADARIAFVKEHLNTFSDVPMSEDELSEIAIVLTEYLASLGK